MVSDPIDVWFNRHSAPHGASNLLLIIPTQTLFKITVSYRRVKGGLWGKVAETHYISHQTRRLCFEFKSHQMSQMLSRRVLSWLCNMWKYSIYPVCLEERKVEQTMVLRVSTIHKDQIFLKKQHLLLFINSFNSGNTIFKTLL